DANAFDGILVDGDSDGNSLGAIPSFGLQNDIFVPLPIGPGPSTENIDLTRLNLGNGGLVITRNGANGIELRSKAQGTAIQNALIGGLGQGNGGDGVLVTTENIITMISQSCISGNNRNGITV